MDFRVYRYDSGRLNKVGGKCHKRTSLADARLAIQALRDLYNRWGEATKSQYVVVEYTAPYKSKIVYIEG